MGFGGCGRTETVFGSPHEVGLAHHAIGALLRTSDEATAARPHLRHTVEMSAFQVQGNSLSVAF